MPSSEPVNSPPLGTPARTREFLGVSFTALCGGALAINLVLIVAILGLIGYYGGRYFWQKDLLEVRLADGRTLLGEIHETEMVPAAHSLDGQEHSRFQLRTGNRDITGQDFLWIDEREVEGRSHPEDGMVIERLEWGNFYGRATEIRAGDQVLAAGVDATWKALPALLDTKRRERDEIRSLEKGKIGDVNYAIERLRLAERKLEFENLPAAELERRRRQIAEKTAVEQKRYDELASELFRKREELDAERITLETFNGETKVIPVGGIVRALRPNAMSTLGKLGLYLSRIKEFVADDPRESNTEGGIFPAIFGTVMMVFLMSIAVVPLGVLAALYLREYAKQGPLVRMVRIAVNNLAGVPSIVFGVFGLGFFVYVIGGSVDRIFYPEALPTPTYGTGGILWGALTLALLTVPVVIVATEEGLAAVPRIVREGSLALGATKAETTFQVVLPAAAPGILTGLILAMARAAGEVAPLMIVGMVKLAPTLPIDGRFPFVHFERKFMHLGFHIYDVGFQSPNVDATKPLVFATALLLIVVVTAMNLVAIAIRNRLRRKYAGAAV